MKTVNGKIACTPFPRTSLSSTVKGGVAVIDQQQSLQALTVVVDCHESGVKQGDVVYVGADRFNTVWAKAKYRLSGEEFVNEFILVPWQEVVLVDKA